MSKRPKNLRMIILVSMFILAPLGAYVYWVIDAPYRTVRQFVRAIEQRDGRMLLKLSLPAERKPVHLTVSGINAALSDLYDGPVVKDEIIPTSGWQKDNFTRETMYQAVVFWNDKNNKPISGKARYMNRNQAFGSVIARSTSEGWRISVSDYLYVSYRSRYGHTGYFTPYARAMEQSQIFGHVDKRNDFYSINAERSRSEILQGLRTMSSLHPTHLPK